VDNYHPNNSSFRQHLVRTKFFTRLLSDVFFTKNRKVEASQNFGNYDVEI
jgi:hypothetical protein